MSFYTSLTGLNAATAMLGVTSNNISNVGTTGFKRSRADFGDIFATSPLQKASSTVGQGVSLKQVSQEFSQGNISFSSNALDLAITGDGFFPMRSADGLQELFTRNGSFLLNEQFNVVNSTGQRLMAATVDSTGSANVNERVVLTIPQSTSGEAKQTSLVQLGLNFPADAEVISSTFNRTNPATYNKSTAFTVYDNGGNGYLATIYYVKTANANQNVPFNKWQTYVFVGEDAVAASLVQSTDTNGEKLYVNQYGEIQPYSVVKDELTTAKTQLFSLDELTDKRTSVPATIDGASLLSSSIDFTNGINFNAITSTSNPTLAPPIGTAADVLSSLFTIDVDKTGNPVTLDLSHLRSINAPLTGSQIAAEATAVLNRKFGDESFFDFSATGANTFNISTSRIASTSNTPVQIQLVAGSNGITDLTKVTIQQAVTAIQQQLSASTILNGTGATAGSVKVSYDYSTQGFKFTDATNTITLKSGTSKNEVMGLTTTAITLDESGGYSAKVIPNGAVMRAASEQRYGMKVTFDSVNRVFKFQSGKTGDNSSLDVTNVNGAGLALFGLSTASVAKTELATRGIESTPAVAVGAAPTINLSNNFAVDATNNTFVVTVDGIKGTVKLPVDSNYSLSTFMAKLEKGINAMGANSATGGVPPTVNGVKVTFDQINNRFVFTTGTTGADSFIKISGSSNWGLETVEAGRGTTTSWIKPTQHQDFVGGAVQPKYIDGAGNETTNGDGFTTLPAWSPIYLDKGELTFDTGGNLVSPVEGTQLETVYLAGGKGALTINIDYSASTQFSSAFAVLSQSQDGAPEGDLVGVTIANDGLVSASFSNGTQKSLAKILLVNFSSPAGLRQIGDSSFLASAASGDPIIGTAGSAGFGTLRAGATERANVDLTQELVDLITAQRNFQANAKAIETSSTMTSAIINLRS
jgi:flagellar hook-basal body protein